MNILIIGGNGFIGRHLIDFYYSPDNKITVFDRSEAQFNKENIVYIQKDLKDIGEEVIGADVIFDLAGTTDNYAIQDGEPFRDINANCIGTLSLLEALRKYNPTAKLVYASTFFVNGHAKNIPVNEDERPDPL